MTNPAPKWQQDLRGGVGIIPLSSPLSHVIHHVTMTQCYPVDVPTLNNGPCALQLCI